MLSVIKKLNSLSFLEGKMRKSAVVITSLSLVVASGFFLYQVFAAGVTVVKPTGGLNISLDTSSQVVDESGATALIGNISIQESIAGEVTLGVHTFSLPTGFRFDPTSSITLSANWASGFDISGFPNIVPDPGNQSFSFNVTAQSNEGTPVTINISGLRIQPTNTTPVSGAITHSGTLIAGVTDGVTSFGNVSSVAGAPVNTYIETAVAGSGNTPLEMTSQTIVAGSSLPVVYSVRRDQFDNFIDNYAATWTMEGETGGVVDGDLTPAGGNLSATFTSTKVGTAVIRATVAGTTSIDSALITVTPAAPDAPTATDGPIINEAEEIAGFVVRAPLGVSGAIEGDTLELLLGGASFSTPLVRTLDATDVSNGYYDFTVVSGQLGVDGGKVITAKVIDNGNVGPEGPALGLTLDTTAPDGYSVAIDTDPVNNTNETNFTFTFSGAEVGATYNYSIDDTNGGTSAVTGSGTISTATDVISGINISSLDDDTLTLTVSLTDEAGNVGGNITDSVIKDTVAPVVSEITPVAVNINDLTPDYTFNSTEAGTITYGGSCSSATVVAISGDNAITFNTLSETLHNDCTVSVTDATGNVSNVLDISDFTVDVTAPTVVLTTGASDPTNVSPISVTAEFSEDVTGFVVGDIVTGNGTAGNFIAVDGNTYTFDITPSGQGSVTVDIAGGVAEDAATNANITATQLARVYDSLAPAAPVITTPGGASVDINIANKDGQTIFGTAEADSVVKLYVDSVEKVSVTATGGNFSFSNADLITAGIVSGTDYWTTSKAVVLTATDSANNTSVNSDSITYRQDTIVPDVNAGDDKVVNAQASQDATVSDAGSGIATYLWEKVSGSGTITFETASAEDTTIEASAEDIYEIKLTATDTAGNSTSDTISFKWDVTSPTVAITYNPVSPVGEGAVTITATYSEPISGIPTISIDQPGTTDITTLAMTDSVDQTVWTYDYTVVEADGGAYIDGTATVSLSATTDPALNVSAGPTSNTFVIDTGEPVITIDSPVDDDVIKTTNGTVTVATTVTDASSYTCAYKVDAGTYQATACDGDIVDAVSFTDGRHTLTMKAVDDGGNFSEDSVSIVIDTNNDLTVAGSGADFTLIQTAVDKATGGDTISIGVGTFSESVDVAKQLTINGSGNDSTIVDPAVGSYGFKITTDGVSINNLQIQTEFVLNGTDDSGIIIREADNLTLSGNKIISASGTDVNGAEGSLGIWVCGTESGCTGSNNLTVDQNIITINGVSTGMYAEQVNSTHSGWSITNNTITANDGITLELYDVTSSTVDDNTFDGSVTNSNVIWSSQRANINNLTFTNNTVSDSSGSMVAFMSDIWELGDGLDNTAVSTVLINGNTFNTWGSRGLRIGADVSGVTISANVFTSGSGESVKNESVNPVTASGNTYSDFASNPGYPTAYDIFDGATYTGGTDATPVGALDEDVTLIETSPTSITVNNDGSTKSTITVLAKGNNSGNLLAGIDPSLIIISSTNASSTISAVTDAGSGAYTATIYSPLAGADTITVAIDSVDIIDGTQVIYLPGDLDHIIFTAEPEDGNDAGINYATQPQVTLYDQFNNIITTDSTTEVTISAVLSSDDTTSGTGTLNADNNPLAVTNGVATFSGVNYTKIDSIKLKATSGAKNALTSAFQNVPGSLASFSFSFDGPQATAGTATTTLVTALDAYGNKTTKDTDASTFLANESITVTTTANVSPNNSTPVYSGINMTGAGAVSSVDLTTGQFTTSNIIFYKSGETPQVTITHDSVSGQDSVAVVAATLTTLDVSATPNPLTTAQTSNITINGIDNYGNIVDDSSTNVDFLYSGENFTMNPTTGGTLTSGTLSATMQKSSTGSVLLTVQSGSLTSDNISIVFTDGTSPTATTNPNIGDPNVLRTVQPVLTFSETMNTDTLIADNIQLKKYDGTDIGVSVNIINSTQVRLVPSALLDYSSEYYYYISSAVLDANGVSFTPWDDSNKDAHKFETEAAETEAPYIANWTPADNSKDVPVDTNIILNFHEKLNQTDITNKFKLRPYTCTNDDCNIPITVTYNDSIKQITINPDSDLSYGQQYYIYVVSTLKDLVGNQFGSSWQNTGDDESQHEFTTIQGMTVNVYAEKTTAVKDDTYVNGWIYRYEMTLNTAETKLQAQFPTGWTSATGGSIATDGNMRMLIDEGTGGQITGLWDEAFITNGDGNTIKSYALNTTYAGQNPLQATIGALDNNTGVAGRQIIFYVFTKIPALTANGIYTASYGIQTGN